MRNLVICIIAGCFLFCSPLYGDSQTIKIGLVSVLSGENAPTGLDVKDAIEFANKKFGKNRYTLVVEDDRCLGKDGVSVANKLVTFDSIRGAVGFTCSSSFLPAAQIYEKAKIPVVIGCASSPKISDAGEFIFRTALEDGSLGRLLGEYVRKVHIRIAVLSELTDYGEDLKDVFVEAVEGPHNVVFTEDFLSNTADFKAVLLRMKAKNPEALFINSQAEKTFAIILQQLQEIGWKPVIYGAYWPGSPELLEIAKENLEGVIFADTPPLSTMLNEDGKTLLSEYKAQGGQIRSVEAMWASSVEAFRALDAALQSGEEARHFLSTNTFHGIFGDYSFNEKGEIRGVKPVLKIIRQGKPELFIKP